MIVPPTTYTILLCGPLYGHHSLNVARRPSVCPSVRNFQCQSCRDKDGRQGTEGRVLMNLPSHNCIEVEWPSAVQPYNFGL